ncbi:5-methyltetrahydrofolate--homocysteine methyltransferase [Desulforhopalus singaporensis]|uniref:5-methyltetrahydrofolate--homocysteine methyltransferase n=2 Tax=Desulforhopalus singaporensis TaxID=91360 RepID=A0A1H0LBD6_9BACT|nr:5-methyltetrahydrofolate--homocysteine methyltransferase [Desulforhopalus singaporensis]
MDLMEKIAAGGLIFDGAMGSMLFAEGLSGGKPSELWNIEQPETIEKIHRAYFDAGADVATTNTFGATPFKLEKSGITADAGEINRSGVEAARRAAGPGNFVAGDIGPLGEMLRPAGMLDPEQAVDHFARQAAILEEAGVDLFIIETFFDLNEILAALQGIKKVSGKPVFATMTFQKKAKGFFTLMGNSPGDSMKRLVDCGASVVGANCSLASDTMITLAQKIRESVDSPVIIQPNAGAPESIGDIIRYPETASFFAENIAKIKALGVEVVGGCCGTTPDFIREIAS